MKTQGLIFFNGVLFGLGLGVSQMTRPPKILAFLNVTGDWDPTLLVVFAAATFTYLIIHRWVFGEKITGSFEKNLRPKEKIEPRTLIGPVIFGIGWGIIGLCPGPAVTNILSGKPEIYLFILAMVAGMYCERLNVFKKRV